MFKEAVDISSVLTEKTGLNGKIFENGGKLKSDVREHMLKIAYEFYKFLQLNYKITDIYFTGSMANYNWTSKSDIDVHIVFESEEEDELLSNYIFAKKHIWSEEHSITIKGFPVEVFAKNVDEKLAFKSIYSLTKDEWEVRPNKTNKVIEKEIIQEKADVIANSINELCHIDNLQKRKEEAEKIKTKIKNMRIAG